MNRQPLRPYSRAGFTLIEALVTLLLILEMSQGQNAGDSAGDFSQQGFPNFRWQSSITPFSLDTSGMNMQEVHLTVTWPVRSHQESMMLSSLAYNHLTQTSQQ